MITLRIYKEYFLHAQGYFVKKKPIDKGNRSVALTPGTLSGFPTVIAADKHFKNLERVSRNLKSMNNLQFRWLLFSVEQHLVIHSVSYRTLFVTQLAKGVLNFSPHSQNITRKNAKNDAIYTIKKTKKPSNLFFNSWLIHNYCLDNK